MINSGSGFVGVIVIGRNEGERLKRCLHSLRDDCPVMVYVDSGSTDGSIEFAKGLGVAVVSLDLSVPFTMARGRNAGFRYLCDHHPEIEYVQFVDGDCEVVAGWISAARATLNENADVVAVCGRRRERSPEFSIFNQLCDVEWDRPPGVSKACGGDALFRVAPLRESGGYNERMIAGEEGELCFRLREKGWKILRIASEMTLHDAALSRWSQWFRRTIRTGHAYAEGSYLHRDSTEGYNRKSVRSAIIWGAVVPLLSVMILACGLIFDLRILWGLCIPAAGYAQLMLRGFMQQKKQGRNTRLASLVAIFWLLGKFPEAIGVIQFWKNHVRGRRTALIEYK